MASSSQNIDEKNEITIEHLCVELLIEIFSNLDAYNLKNSLLVCKNWNDIIGTSEATMKKLVLKIDDLNKFRDMNFRSHQKYQNISIRARGPFPFDKVTILLESFNVSHVKNFHYDDIRSIPGKLFLSLLSRMPNLEILGMGFATPILTENAQDFVHLPKLKKLSINPVTSNCYDQLVIENLEEYDCDFGRPSFNPEYEYNLMMSYIKRYKKLNTLTLSSFALVKLIKNKMFREWECQLTCLNISLCSNTVYDDQAFVNNFRAFLISQASSLTKLTFESSRDVLPKRIVSAIFKELTNLKFLGFSEKSPPLPEDDLFFTNLNSLQSVRKLYFETCIGRSHNYKFDGEFFQKFPNIETLISRSYNLEVVKHAATYNLKLTNLTILSLSNVTGGLKFVGLKYLEVESFFEWLQLENLQMLLKSIPTLETLKIFLSSGLSVDNLAIKRFFEILRESTLSHLKLCGSTKLLKEFFKEIAIARDFGSLKTLNMKPRSTGDSVTFEFPIKSGSGWITDQRELPENWIY